MPKVDDIRDTRVYRDAKEEARLEERERIRQEELPLHRKRVANLAAIGFSATEIADVLGLELDFVHEELSKQAPAPDVIITRDENDGRPIIATK